VPFQRLRASNYLYSSRATGNLTMWRDPIVEEIHKFREDMLGSLTSILTQFAKIYKLSKQKEGANSYHFQLANLNRRKAPLVVLVSLDRLSFLIKNSCLVDLRRSLAST